MEESNPAGHVDPDTLTELRTLRERVAQLEQERRAWQQQQGVGRHDRLVDDPLPGEANASFHYERSDNQYLALDTIFNTITDSLVVYDQQGRVIRSNTAWLSLMGAKSVEDLARYTLVERSVRVHLRDGQGRPVPPDRLPAVRLLRGESIVNDDMDDVMITTLDNQRILRFAVSGEPVRDSEGNVVGAVAVLHNITSRRQAEQRTSSVLQSLLEMAEALVEGIHHPDKPPVHASALIQQLLSRLTELGQSLTECLCLGVTLINQATSLLEPVTVAGDVTPEMRLWQHALTDRPLSRYFSPEQLVSLHAGHPARIVLDPTALLSDTSAYVSEDEPLRVSCYLIVPMLMGQELIGLLSLDYGLHIRNFSQEQLAQSIIVARLISLTIERERLYVERAEEKANEQSLLEANRRMDEFLSMASHELRTPLTTIHGNIQLARRRLKQLTTTLQGQIAEDQLKKLLQTDDLLLRAERQVRVQNRLVSDLLDVSRIQANRLELNMDKCDLSAIVLDTINNQQMATGREIVLERDLFVDDMLPPLPVYADADRIGQVFTNFLSNALKYSAEDCIVSVRLTIDGNAVTVRVRDEGPGIPTQELPHIWERFYRVPGIAVQSGSSGVGLGLGLHICRTIVERHNGMVGVESTEEAGSTFWFTLPLVEIETGSSPHD